MPTSIIHLDEKYDKKVAILKIERGVKNKNIVLEDIIREYFDKKDEEKKEE